MTKIQKTAINQLNLKDMETIWSFLAAYPSTFSLILYLYAVQVIKIIILQIFSPQLTVKASIQTSPHTLTSVCL